MTLLRIPLLLLFVTIGALGLLPARAGSALTTLVAGLGDPSATLVAGSDGNYYGTTYSGGASRHGTVFKVTPEGVLTTLVTFRGTNGSLPSAPLLLARDGNFYGTTREGGRYNYGTVFKMTPAGTLTTLVSFNGTNGYTVYGGLIEVADGVFYGTTGSGGAYGNGTVYKITSAKVFTTLASIQTGYGASSLTLAKDGNFYGTTTGGGDFQYGTIFRMTPAGELTTLASFNGTNGSGPEAGLIQAKDGNFYGVANWGGNEYKGGLGTGLGTIFKMTPEGVLTVFFAFNRTDGAMPTAALLESDDGNFYGTTNAGGSANLGTVFRLTPTGSLTTLVSFNGSNGNTPYRDGLVQGADGTFYGATFAAAGTLFRISATNPQTITFPPVTGATFNRTVTLKATASSGLPVSYTILSGPAVLTGNQLKFLSIEPVTVAASQAGNSRFEPASTVTQTIYADQASQSISPFPLVPTQVLPAPPFLITLPTASSGLPVVLTLVSGPADVSGNSIFVTGPGVVTLAANQPGGPFFKPAKEVRTSFVVKKGSQSFALPIFTEAKPTDVVPLPIYSSANLPITYTVVSGPANLFGNNLVFNGAGTVRLMAEQPGNGTYNAAGRVILNIRSTKLSQTIPPLAPIATQTFDRYMQPIFPVPAVASSGLRAIYSIKSGPATTDGFVITVTGTGNVVVAANQAGNEIYAPAREVTTSFKVDKGVRKFEFYPISDQGLSGQPTYVPIQAFAYPDALITYRVAGPASLANGILTLTGGGVVRVTASVAADANFLAVSVTQSFAVTKHPQSIDFQSMGVVYLKPDSLPVELRAFAQSGLPVTYKVTGPATLSGNLLTLTGIGNVTVTAYQPGDSTWAAAKNVSQTFKVIKAL